MKRIATDRDAGMALSPLREVVILGCGGSSGVPIIGGDGGRGRWGTCDPSTPENHRSRSSIILLGEQKNLLVDTGPDLRHQLLQCGIERFDAVFYTHAHADHIAGLDEVRAMNWMLQKPVEAWGSAVTLNEIEERFAYAFRPWTPEQFFRPGLVSHPVNADSIVQVADFELDVFRQNHGLSDSFGFRHANFAYCTDVVEISDHVLDRLMGLDVWVVDCFQKEPHSSHAWLERVLEWHARIQPRRTVLTHMGPAMDWNWMQEHLPDGIEPAFDGMRISF